MIEKQNKKQSYSQPDEHLVSAAAASVGLSGDTEESDGTKYPGTSRAPYVIILAVIAAALSCCFRQSGPYVLVTELQNMLLPAQAVKTLAEVTIWLLLICFVGVSISRLQNVGWNWYVLLSLCVPMLNLWTMWVLFACPPGYQAEKKLGVSGILMTLLLVVLVILSGVGAWWLLAKQGS